MFAKKEPRKPWLSPSTYYLVSNLPAISCALLWIWMLSEDSSSGDMKGLGILFAIAGTILLGFPFSMWMGGIGLSLIAHARAQGEDLGGITVATVIAFLPVIVSVGALIVVLASSML